MKKNNLYIVIAVLVGFLGGFLIFGNNAKDGANAAHDHVDTLGQHQIWTCSMHPQIRQPEAGTCPICGMDLIPVEVGDDGLASDQFRLTENAVALANIRTTVVGTGKADGTPLKLSGKIQENVESNAVQASYFEGRIEKLNVTYEGQEVRKGQQLATIYSPELVSAQQELITAAGLKATQPALYNAVRNKLKLWKLSDKQISEIENSGKVRENFPVYANVSGTISMIMVAAGDYVKQGTALFKIADLSAVWAVFDAYENQVSLLREGQHISIVTNVDPNHKMDAIISFVDPIMNMATRTIEIRAVLNNTKDALKPGMFISGWVDLGVNIKDNDIIIPESAVLWTGERSVVYIRPNPDAVVFEMREVTLGNAVEDGYIVLDGLQNGDVIVTNGTFTVDAAAQLKGKRSMMNEEAGNTTTGHENHSGM